MNLFFLGITWATYYSLHSLLAARRVKRLLHQNLIPEKWYRLFFNFLSIVLTVPLAIQFFVLEKEILFDFGWLKWVGVAFVFAGGWWLFRAMKSYDLNEFLGFSKMGGETKFDPNQLVVNGLNAKVRHPLYFGTLLVLVGVFLLYPTDASLVILCISVLYLIIGSRLEERKLEQQFGEAYRSYQRNVPMLIPFPWKRRRK